MSTTYKARPIKRTRRTRAEIEALKDAMYRIVEEDRPMTVRQVFYRMVSEGQIGKTEAEYKNTVTRLLAEMRLAGEMPFSWLADNTRWMRKPAAYDSLEAMLKASEEAYRRDLWANQAAYVEVWLEKDALSGVLYEVTAPWDVPLMVTRGYPSLSYLHTAAEAIRAARRPAYLYYFGDHDPSGLDIPRNVEDRLREFAPEAEIHFTRLAVTPRQIEEMSLPTRPTKRTDSRAKSFRGESVEVDAIPPRTLRAMAKAAIEAHIEPTAYAALRRAEEEEREAIRAFRLECAA